jgi:hypothetical protein
MTTIIGYLDLLMEGGLGDVPPRMRRPLALVHRNARRLDTILDDLLELNRLQRGRITAAPAPGELCLSVERAAEQVRSEGLLGERRVVLEPVVGLPVVSFDPARFEQALVQLLRWEGSRSRSVAPLAMRLRAVGGGRVEVALAAGGAWTPELAQWLSLAPEPPASELPPAAALAGLPRWSAVSLAIGRGLLALQGGWVTLQRRPEGDSDQGRGEGELVVSLGGAADG